MTLCEYTYTGTDERYYPTLGITATPGLVVSLSEMPTDGRWELATDPAAAEPAPTNL